MTAHTVLSVHRQDGAQYQGDDGIDEGVTHRDGSSYARQKVDKGTRQDCRHCWLHRPLFDAGGEVGARVDRLAAGEEVTRAGPGRLSQQLLLQSVSGFACAEFWSLVLA